MPKLRANDFWLKVNLTQLTLAVIGDYPRLYNEFRLVVPTPGGRMAQITQLLRSVVPRNGGVTDTVFDEVCIERKQFTASQMMIWPGDDHTDCDPQLALTTVS